MNQIFMYGDGPGKTVVTGSKNFVDSIGTMNTATFDKRIKRLDLLAASSPSPWDSATQPEPSSTKRWRSECRLTWPPSSTVGWTATRTCSTCTPPFSSTFDCALMHNGIQLVLEAAKEVNAGVRDPLVQPALTSLAASSTSVDSVSSTSKRPNNSR
ncbi:hypothetical protein ZIOFF_074117 [Zingiber officinale]|uniref:Uncharacterized protein n=1 Tax=Zingiber officinale TaxID=94328 RepID=A0A8J5C6Y2_ZINOF|nr:hypothetical protein ZIOFF_074117 [Zingiber officinale]